jgi:predicted DNA-binding transcriptional regulator AlpA
MTREELRAKWSARRAEWETLGVTVIGAKICEECIADFENVLTSHDEAVLNTNEAAAMTGYSRAQLLHLYKQGRLRGYKKGKNVFFRAGDLPRKPRGGQVAAMPNSAPFDQGTRAAAQKLAEKLRMAGSR